MPYESAPTFLNLPERATKPRRSGLTHVLDKGLTLNSATDLLTAASGMIDIWKFGWGISYIDPSVKAKVSALHNANVKACTGGTLLELAWVQNCTQAFFDFAEDVGFDCVEVSNGATPMPLKDKHALILKAHNLGFEVMAEVGSKDAKQVMSTTQWRYEIEGDVGAGADWIIAEGRESGNVGLYDEAGGVRYPLLRALENSIYASQIIYEAPLRNQQSFLINHLGTNANLGNVSIHDVLGLETLRLGLRADTLDTTRCDTATTNEQCVCVYV